MVAVFGEHRVGDGVEEPVVEVVGPPELVGRVHQLGLLASVGEGADDRPVRVALGGDADLVEARLGRADRRPELQGEGHAVGDDAPDGLLDVGEAAVRPHLGGAAADDLVGDDVEVLGEPLVEVHDAPVAVVADDRVGGALGEAPKGVLALTEGLGGASWRGDVLEHRPGQLPAVGLGEPPADDAQIDAAPADEDVIKLERGAGGAGVGRVARPDERAKRVVEADETPGGVGERDGPRGEGVQVAQAVLAGGERDERAVVRGHLATDGDHRRHGAVRAEFREVPVVEVAGRLPWDAALDLALGGLAGGEGLADAPLDRVQVGLAEPLAEPLAVHREPDHLVGGEPGVLQGLWVGVQAPMVTVLAVDGVGGVVGEGAKRLGERAGGLLGVLAASALVLQLGGDGREALFEAGDALVDGLIVTGTDGEIGGVGNLGHRGPRGQRSAARGKARRA